MRLLLEGEVSRARRRIVDVKNEVAQQIVSALQAMGLRQPKVEYADSGADDAIIYLEAGNNHLIASPQTVMIRIVTDTDIQIQIPHQLSQMLTLSDFFQVETPDQVMEVIRRIVTNMRAEIQSRGYGPNITVGNIGEGP